MSVTHHIGELLRRGAEPTAEEVEHLTELGAFVASMYGRYVHGREADAGIGAGSDGFADAMGSRLGAATGDRWSRGIGIGESLLDNEWSHWWQVAARGFAAGYQDYDVELQNLALYDDEPERVVEVVEGAPARRRRESLFGPRRGATSRGLRPVRQILEQVAGKAARPALKWADGGPVELATVEALERGGLRVADQVAPRDRGFLEQIAATRGQELGGGAGLAGPPARRSGATAPERGTRSLTSLDGLLVDNRTPALSSALGWAEAMFGSSDAAASGMALTNARINAFAPSIASAGVEPSARRPVFGFFDAVEGDFVSLVPEVPVADRAAAPTESGAAPPTRRASLFATAQAAAERQAAVAPVRRASSPTPGVTRRAATSPSPVTRAAGGVRPSAGGPAAVVSTSLSTVAPLRGGDDRVLAFTGGTFPVASTTTAAAPGTGALQFATQVTRDRQGIARPRTQRGNATAPRIEVLEAGAPTPRRAIAVAGPSTTPSATSSAGVMAGEAAAPASAPVAATAGPAWRLAADRGPDLPLAATMTAAELFGAVAAPWNQFSTPTERAAFSPVVSRSAEAQPAAATSRPGFTSAAFGAVDGVVWVAAEHAPTATAATAEPGEALPLSLVPRGRRATMLPAREALQVVSNRAAAQQVASGAAVSAPSVATPAASGSQTPSSVTRGASLGAVAQSAQRVRSGLVAPSVAAPVLRAAMQRGTFAEAIASGSTGIAEALAQVGVAPSLARWMAASGGVSAELVAAFAPPARAAQAQVGQVALAGEALAASQAAPLVREQATLTTPAFATRPDAVLGAGSYHSLAAAQELVQLADEAAPVAAAEAGAEAPRPVAARSLLARFDGAAAEAVAPQTLRAVAAAGRSETPVPVQEALRAFAGGASLDVTASRALSGGATASVPALEAARHALQRPVMTAREARAVAPLMSLVQVAGAPSAPLATVSAGQGQDFMPTLSRAVAAASAVRQSLGRSGQGAGGAASIAMLAQLEPAQLGVVTRTLRAAGWSDVEFEMLSLGEDRPATASFDAAVADEAPLAASVRRQTIRRQAALAAAEPERRPTELARAAHASRNLARVMLGAEALGGGVESVPGVASRATSQAASAQMSTFMPIIARGAADPYFGATAPESTTRGTATFALRDAIGELLALASDVSAVSDSPLDQAARTEILHRVAAAEAMVERSARARVQSVTTGEATGVTGAASGLGEDVFARGEARQLGLVDATTVSSAAEVTRPSLAALLGRAEHTFLAPVAESSTESAGAVADEPTTARAAGAAVRRASLVDRVASALNVAASGPVGAERLLGPVARGSVVAGGGREAGRAPLAQQVRRASAMQAPVALDSVIVPEAMLNGLRSPELSRAMQIAGGSDGPGVLTGLLSERAEGAPVEVDGSLETRAIRAVVPPGREEVLRARAASMAQSEAPTRAEAVRPQPARRSQSLFGSDPVQVLLRVAGSEPGGMERALSSDRSVAGSERRAALFSALIQSADRREVASLFQKSGASEFAYAWLSRVDGSRTGLDLGMDGAKTEMRRAFGGQSRRVESRVAGSSPIAEAGLVSTASAPRSEDRGGLRNIAAPSGGLRGSARSQHAASAAVRRTDWRFVETGSRASTSHADLGRLAAAIVSQSQTAQKAPMPLIAPAAKAVAQSALRNPTNEAPTGKKSSKPAQKAGGADKGKGEKVTLSEEAMEQLAFEMVGRIVRRLGQDKERIGIWG
ncbi:MAG: hypothetical protein H6745_27115 [Deltaproteobacteria bacterium]|nr:hypothetical protein [Deltaproteobacteria bacterium]